MTVTPDGLSIGPGGVTQPAEIPPSYPGREPLHIRTAHAGTVKIEPGARLVVGSSADADLTLPGMLGQHAVFYVQAGEWTVAPFTTGHSEIRWPAEPDHQPRPMFGPHILRAGDVVALGTVEFAIVPV